MLHSDNCPHCGKETDVEAPWPGEGPDERVEVQQECPHCGQPIVGVFKVEYVLQEVRRA